MVDADYKIACTEVLEILKYVSKEDYNKIPKNIIDVLENDKDENFSFNYDETRTLTQQNVSKNARLMIAIFFRDYWANENQRKHIITNEQKYREQKEQEKREKYNVENIFENRKVSINTQEKSISEKKSEKWYEKIFSFIKNFFKD